MGEDAGRKSQRQVDQDGHLLKTIFWNYSLQS